MPVDVRHSMDLDAELFEPELFPFVEAADTDQGNVGRIELRPGKADMRQRVRTVTQQSRGGIPSILPRATYRAY